MESLCLHASCLLLIKEERSEGVNLLSFGEWRCDVVAGGRRPGSDHPKSQSSGWLKSPDLLSGTDPGLHAKTHRSVKKQSSWLTSIPGVNKVQSWFCVAGVIWTGQKLLWLVEHTQSLCDSDLYCGVFRLHRDSKSQVMRIKWTYWPAAPQILTSCGHWDYW